MKKLFIILVMICLSLPVFASDMNDYTPIVPYARMYNPNVPTKPIIYDNSEQQAYHKKLKQAYFKKYSKRVDAKTIEFNAPEGAYYKEVVEPYYEYLKTHPCKMEPLNKY